MNEKMPTPVVRELSSLNVTGHVIPQWWLGHIRGSARSDGDKPNLLAAYILADVRYWHLMEPIENAQTGEHLGWKKKFAVCFWQQSYEQFAQRLGYTTRQVKDACTLLVEYGLIALLFHHVRISAEIVIPNRMYVLPIPSRIRWITESDPTHMRLSRMPIDSMAVPAPQAYSHLWSGGVARYGRVVLPEMARWYGHLWQVDPTINGANTENTTQRSQDGDHNTENTHNDDDADSLDDSLRSSSRKTRARVRGNAKYPAPVLDGPDDDDDEDDDIEGGEDGDDEGGVDLQRLKALESYCLAKLPLAFPGFDAALSYIKAMSNDELLLCAKWIWFVGAVEKKVEPGFLRWVMQQGEAPDLSGAKRPKKKAQYKDYDIFADFADASHDRGLTWQQWEEDVAYFERQLGLF